MTGKISKILAMTVFYKLAIPFLLLTSCVAPRVHTQIIPDAPEGNFAMGREYISLSNDSIEVELGFDGIYGEQLVFDFVVINRSPFELTINPSDFYYVVLDSATADSSKFPPRMSFHPERVLHQYDETLEARAGAKKVNSIFGILEAGLDILMSASGFIATDNPAFIADGVFNTLGTAQHYVSTDKEIEENMALIQEEKELVEEEILRPCRLAPGKVISGYVFYPQDSDADCYMFCYPIEDQLFQFVYHQKKVVRYD